MPRMRPDPGRPTAKEQREHNVTHYPFRSWCRHCLRGRGVSRPHTKRSDEDKEFSKNRVPTISLDHCFPGTEDSGEDGASVPALENPFLVMYDADSEAIYCLPVATKGVNSYVVQCVKSVIDELGYSDVRIALKNDAAPELIQLREQVRQIRNAPTASIDVPVQESRMNGAVERAVRSWEGQFRTIRDHRERDECDRR